MADLTLLDLMGDAAPAPARRGAGVVARVGLLEALAAACQLWRAQASDPDAREAAELAVAFSKSCEGKPLPRTGLEAARMADCVMRDAWAGSRWWALFGAEVARG